MKLKSEDNNIEKKDGVFVSPLALANFKDFETHYLYVRSKENRILSIREIRDLPNVDPNYVHFSEWEIRKKNIKRFLTCLSKNKRVKRILDIGCGNGFFTNMLAKDHEVVGVDVNLTELKQAAEAFSSSDIRWYYLDILAEHLPENKFDLITFCASFQYFENPKELLKRCFELLNDQGEIHIIDSPFYSPEKLETARLNSLKYYQTIGSEKMNLYYKHNTYHALEGYQFRLLYKPNSLIRRLLRIKDSPFPWIRIKLK